MIGCWDNINCEFSKKKVCFSRISRLKVTYMFMALTNSLVVLFIAVLLHIFSGNFYSDASCFPLLWLYLGNSQVSVYRTIGPTLVLVVSNNLSQSVNFDQIVKFCVHDHVHGGRQRFCEMKF